MCTPHDALLHTGRSDVWSILFCVETSHTRRFDTTTRYERLLINAILRFVNLQKVEVSLSAMSHLRFCRAILSRNSDARQRRSVRLHSRTLRL